MGFFRPEARKGMTPMSKTNEWVDGSRTPAHGTRTRSLRGSWGMVWGRFAGVVVVGACVAWGMGAGGVARGQGVTKQIRVSPEFRTWYEQHKESEMSRRGRGAKEPIHEGEGSGYGLIPDLYDMSYLSRLNVGVVQTVGASYPQRYDLRDKGWVTDVKNQHPYGTCWAHATFGSLESHLKKSQGVEYDFSENNLVNLQEWDYSGWWGANAAAAEGYLLHWMGPVMEEDDHYYAVNGSERMAPAYHVQQVRWIPGKSSATDNDRIKEAVTQYGGLWVSYYHEDPYLSPNNAYYYTGNSNGNHAVTLVGWDDAYPKENFASEPPGDGAYIVKNSWGKRWGEDGYFYVSYYDIRFARSTMYAFCNADSTNNYGKVYEYDPLGFVYESLWRSSTCKQWGANIFTATGDDTLAAVGFYALGPNTSYKISVYTGVSEGAPTSGTSTVSEQSGTLDTAGYFTIPLDKEVKVGKGKRFSVVVEVKTPGHTAPLGLEIALRDVVEKGSDYPTSEATAAKGQSFISFDGATWYDMFLNEEKYRPNFCCKVYTKSATAEKPKLTGVSIHAVDGRSVESGKTGRFRCDATYENGGKKEGVAAKWSVVKGDEWADIDEDTGVLQAEEVGENHTVTIRAVYTEDGVTVDAKGDVQITAGAPGVPKNVKGTAELDNANSLNATISWDAVSGASKYAVYRGDTDAARNARHVYTVAVAKYMDGDAVPGRKYWYFVKAQNGEGSGTLSSDFSTGVQGWRLLAPPTDVKATTDLTDRIDVSWGASAGATHYRVSRSVAPGGTREVLGEWQTDLRFIDRPAQADTPYYYYVAAALDASGSMAAEGELYAEGIRPSPAVPVLEVRGPDSLGSGEDGDFEAYVTYSKGKADEGPLDVKWSVSEGSVSKNGTKARVTAPKMTSSGKVTVTATHERTGLVGRKDVTVTAGLPGQVTGLKVTSETSAGIGLSWNAADGAGGYVVARTGGKGGDATFKTAQTAYTDTTAEVGVEYSYTVSAENAAGGGTPSETVGAFIGLSAPGGVSATADRTDGVRVKWSGTAGATHFRVGRATSQSGTKTELGNGWTTDRTYDDVPPKDNTEYWYFVKAATGADGRHATGWSTGAKGKKVAEKTLTGLAVSGPDRVGSGESAVYSCVASWSGEEQGTTVAAQWSATKGSIGKADGRFQAPSAEADTEVSIVAKYGGMAATQTVTVVGSGVEAKATVSGVTAIQRWPFLGLVDIGYTLETQPTGTKAAVLISAWDEDHGRALAARSLAGDGADGAPLEAGSHQVTWDLAADYPGFHAAAVRVDVAAAVASLAAPEGVTARGATPGIAISWSAVEGAEAYEVWRGTIENDFDSSEKLADATGLEWLDATAEFDVAYYYWVCAIGSGGYHGMLSDCVYGCRVLTPTEILIEGDDKVGSDEYIQYKCLVKFGDVDETYVTPTWSIVGGTGYATVYADGRVRTYSFSSGQGIVLQASYAQNGIEVSTTKTIQISSPTFTIVNGVLTAVSLNGARKVTIPSSVTSIGTNVFENLNLTCVTIPNTVTNIGVRAFYACQYLESLDVPSSVKRIGDHAFYFCASMKSLTLRKGLETIDEGAFASCHGLTCLELPEGLTTLEYQAFSYCTSLTNLVIREGLVRPGYVPFNGCTSLQTMTLPASLKTIGIGGSPIFPYGAKNLQRINVADGNQYYSSENGILFSKDKTALYFVPRNATSFSIPATVTNISQWAFENCDNLKSLTIPAGVTGIGGLPLATLDTINVASGNPVYSSQGGVLYNKDKTRLLMVPKSISSISIPSTVTNIPSSAFANCTNLVSLSIPSGIRVIPTSMCEGCTSLRNVVLPANAVSVEEKAFYECSSIQNMSIPQGLVTIGKQAFEKCSGVVSVSLSNGAISIGYDAFYDCPNLIEVYLPASVTSISNNAFHFCTNLVTLNVDSANPRYVSSGTCILDTTSGKTIAWAGGASSIVVPAGTKTFASGFIGVSSKCSSRARTVTLPASLEAVGDCAFMGWTELENIVLPQGVLTVEWNAFYGCKNLVSVVIPDTVTTLGKAFGNGSTFAECSSLTNVTILGALDDYDLGKIYTSTPDSLTTYVTSKWTGPTDTWCGRPIVVQ